MSKINQELEQKIIKLSVNHTTREIVDILAKEDNVQVSQPAISKKLKSVRQERSEQTKQIVQENIKATLPKDLEILEDIRNQLDNWRKDDNLKVTERLFVIDRLNKVIETRLKHSGAEEPGDSKAIIVKLPGDLNDTD